MLKNESKIKNLMIISLTACGIYESFTVASTSSFPLSEQHYYTVLLSVFGMVANVGMYIPAVINPRCACAARVTVVVLCVCVCVCVCLSHRNLKNGCVKHQTVPRFVH